MILSNFHDFYMKFTGFLNQIYRLFTISLRSCAENLDLQGFYKIFTGYFCNYHTAAILQSFQ